MTLSKKQQILLSAVIAVIGTYLLFPVYFSHGFMPLPRENYFDASLDPSWLITLSYANEANLVWGKDFCFTYGPLAYLPMRRLWGAGPADFILYDLFYAGNFFLLIYLSVKRSANKVVTILLVTAIVIILPLHSGGDSALIWFYILLFWLVSLLTNYNRLYFIPVLLVTTLLFFLKFNTALVSVVLFLATVGYLLLFKKDRLFVLGAVVLLPVLIYLGAVAFNVYLPGYIISGIETVAGYNDIMYLDTPAFEVLLPYILIITGAAVLAGFITFFTEKNIWRNPQELIKKGLVFGLFCAAAYILYKQSVVRADMYHIIYYFVYFVLLMACIPGLFDSGRYKVLNTIVVSGIVGLSFYVLQINSGEVLVIRPMEKLSKKYYFTDLARYRENEKLKIYPNANALPDDILKTIGNNTVDVFPWNAYMLFENGLNYLPRPVMQSYTAYTPYLEDLNFEHYNSDKAPQYVLYSYHSTDVRYPMFDEPKVNLVLLANYNIVKQFTHFGTEVLLLKKKNNAKPVQLEFEREYAMYFGSALAPKKDTYYEVTLYSSAKGKITSLLTHAPAVRMNIIEEGKMQDYKISPALLKSGFFGTYLINSEQDFAELLRQGKTDGDETIDFYKFTGDSKFFKEKIRVKEYKIIH